MSRVGIVMLVHTALGRAEQVARHWTRFGCPVVIHVDGKVPRATCAAFREALSNDPLIRFSRRHRCDWGTWGLVAATQDAAEEMLGAFPDLGHVYLASGACLPLRPVTELQAYLAARPAADFIESATTAEVPWTMGGLDAERFTLRFPFSWRRQRHLFDRAVALQRRLNYRRRLPDGLVPHMGSQWWCLTRSTLSAILTYPRRGEYDRYFRSVWIPDESYFQSLARLHSRTVESRSLTLSKFDFQGKPHIFYDDHLQLLRRSDSFVARKIWPHARRLYDAFLGTRDAAPYQAEPNPGKIDRIFARAVTRRTRGRAGLYMQSRFPNPNWENGVTAARYSVFQGFAELFEGFEDWLSRSTGAVVHGHLYGPDGAAFADGQTLAPGALPATAAARDANPMAFLTNLVWNTRGQRQCFQYGPPDTPAMAGHLARDPNAQVSVISGAWAVPLFRSGRDFATLRREAAALQKAEAKMLDAYRAPGAKARIRIWSLAEFLEAPIEILQVLLDEVGHRSDRRLTEAPRMQSLDGFGQFLQNLKNEGMHPYLMGDFPVEAAPRGGRASGRPYLYTKQG
ncbi:DUF5927 domain-containing protein [Roseivivax sp. CAU 1761]